jgi:transcriptional regulator with XRE-family HTH domain
MKKRTQHNSVAEMVRDLSDDPRFADELVKRLAERQLVKLLTVLRNRAALSQRDLADKLHCTQSWVSKLENGKDADVRVGDLVKYTGATHHEIRLLFVPKGQTILEQVETHAHMIRGLLDRLVELVGNDQKMAKAAKEAVSKVNYNLGKIVQDAINSLPRLVDETPQPLRAEAPPEVDDAVIPEGPPSGARQKATVR